MRRIYVLGSQWCIPCKKIFGDLQSRFDEEVSYVDIDAYPHLSERFNVRALPTVVLTDGSKILSASPVEDSRDALELIQTGFSDDSYTRRCIYREGGEPVRRDLLKIIRFIEDIFDWRSGGLSGGYKLIPYRELDFLIKAYLDTGVKGYLDMVHKTVDIILQSRMVDYGSMRVSHASYTPDWESPDGVYLVEEQAEFARLLTWLNVLTGRRIYLDLAREFYKSALEFIDHGWRGVVEGKPIEWGEEAPNIFIDSIYNLAETGLSPLMRDSIASLKHMVPKLSRGGRYPLITIAKYINMLLSMYKYTADDYFLRQADLTLEETLDWVGEPPLIDSPAPIHGELDRWICRPCRANLLFALTCYRASLYGMDYCLEKFRGILRIRWEPLLRNSLDSALYGLNIAAKIYGFDLVEIYGYGRIPSKISESIKPYTEILYRPGERKIEYISRGFKFKI